MRALVILAIFCFQYSLCFETAAAADTSAHLGWHRTVGAVNAEKIKKEEELLLRNRIVGGAVAPINRHPYLAGLLIDVWGLLGPSACGGSILTSSRILTAAHCWFDGWNQAWRFTVVLGSPFLFHGGMRMQTSSIVLHQEYNSRTFANDIAILRLPVHVSFSENVRPVNLPFGAFQTFDYTGFWGIASGYGRYSDFTTPSTNTMVRHVILQVIPLEQCRAKYGNIVLDTNICTSGEGGVGICQGDSGGPLVVYNADGREILIGVSSFVAKAGCELELPSAFASVPKFLDWILNNL